MTTTSGIEVGSLFESFLVLEEEEIKKYQKRHHVQFYTRDSRKIMTAKQRAPTDRIFNDNLVYSEITYCCVEGGKDYKSQSKGECPNQL